MQWLTAGGCVRWSTFHVNFRDNFVWISRHFSWSFCMIPMVSTFVLQVSLQIELEKCLEIILIKVSCFCIEIFSYFWNFLCNFRFVFVGGKNIFSFSRHNFMSHKLMPDARVFFVCRRDFGCKSLTSCGEGWGWRKSIAITHRRSTSWRLTKF